MAKNITIDPILSESDTDFSLLIQQGITLMQQYSGSIWTDYNEHDPGVTILEELCFVLTELYSRTKISMHDLLTRPDGSFPADDSAFFSAAEILHNHPLTPNDFRRIIVDRVREVRNAWVEPILPVNTSAGNVGIAGMYRVFLDLDSKPADVPEIAENLWKMLNENRNLCEIFVEMVLLKQDLVTIGFDLHVDSPDNVEDMLANLLLRMQSYIRPGIDFFTLSQLMDTGWDTDHIFEGPRLQHGFIPEGQLTEKTSEISVAELLKFAFSMPGIRSISALYINDNSKVSVYKVADDAVAVPDIVESLKKIKVFSNNVAFNFNQNLVISKINEISNKTGQSRKVTLPAQQLDILIPSGIYRAPGEYYSIQNDFPVIYGIGPSGPTDDNPLRKAQALQLKAYLLFFEQTLADYLAQLENINNLFSTTTQNNTYFYQPLYAVPGIADVVKTGITYPVSDNDQYENGLERLHRRFDDTTTRRKQFLGHLLNRFGVEPYVFSHPEVVNEGSLVKMSEVAVAQRMLQKMPVITGKRAAAGAEENAWPVSGLEEIISITTGLKTSTYLPPPAHYHYLVADEDVKKVFWLTDQSGKRQVKLNIGDKSFFALLSAGMNAKSYSVVEESGVQVLYLNLPTPYQLFALQKNEDRATYDIISDLVDDFTAFYFENERFYLVDHLFLKPANNTASFGWVNEGSPSEQGVYGETLLKVPADAEKDLFYVISGSGQPLRSDFYSYRASLVLPDSIFRLRKNAFRDYLDYLVSSYSPAHLCINMVALNAEQYQDFVNQYAGYTQHEPDAVNAITTILLSHQPYINMIFNG